MSHVPEKGDLETEGAGGSGQAGCKEMCPRLTQGVKEVKEGTQMHSEIKNKV